MITPSQTRSKYVSIEQHLEFARSRVRDTLQAFCEPLGYAFISRIKTLPSVSEKIESGRFAKWSDLDDLIACAIVVPTLVHEAAVLEFLERAFVTVKLKRRGSSKKAPDVFRFDTTRYIGKLRIPENIFPQDPLYQIQFEVQVRSAFEHAWSVTTHALTYKETSAKISKSSWPETQAKTKLSGYFKEQFASGLLPDELRPKDWTRFSDNVYDMVRSSPWGQRKHPQHISNEVSTAMDVAIHELGRERIPLSISLVQFVFASLFTAGLVLEPLDGYCPVITSELETLYPALSTFRARFDFLH
jgi:ppGpp synthetase/RelA/SpoT-type nucleotidyltranferase